MKIPKTVGIGKSGSVAIGAGLRRAFCFFVLLPLAFSADADQPGKSPIKVFFLAGQSNMEGQAVVDLNDPRDYNGGLGNLVWEMANSPVKSMYTELKTGTAWTVWKNVWVRYRTGPTVLLKGDLSLGYTVYASVHTFGVELQFGHIVGDSLGNQILLIKAAWGGRDIAVDFRPPSSGGTVGPYYTTMVQYFHEALNNIATDFPGYDGKGYEIAGFLWFHGYNDHLDNSKIAQYEVNCANLIKDLRKEFNAPNMPVVIGEECGVDAAAGQANALSLQKAQQAVADRAEFKGFATYVKTASFVRPADSSPNTGHGHHFYGNAGSFFLMGNAFGQAMVKLLPKSTAAKPAGLTPDRTASSLHIAFDLGAARGVRSIDIGVPDKARVTIRVVDLKGREVCKRTGCRASGVENVDLSKVTSGVYQILVQGQKAVLSRAIAAF